MKLAKEFIIAYSIFCVFDIYLVNDYKGNPQEFEENCSMWINIEDLLNENKKFPSVEIIKYLENNDINFKIYSDDNHNILNIEY